MHAFSSPAFWYQFFSKFRCYECGSLDGFVSRPRNLFEKYGLRLLAMRPARCGDCFRRSYRPARVALLPRNEEFKLKRPAMPEVVAPGQGGEKETNEGTGDPRRIA